MITDRCVGRWRVRFSGASVRALTTDRLCRPDEATIGMTTELLTVLPNDVGAGWVATPFATSAWICRMALMSSDVGTRPCRSSAERITVIGTTP